jgi:hypothetical protein
MNSPTIHKLYGGYKMNVTKKRNKGSIPASLMPRVDACALIFIADKPDKIKGIALLNECDELAAGRIYTIGALKNAKRRGTARNYREAITQLENEQMGDRGDPITRTISEEKTALGIAHINRMNNSGTTAIYRQGFTVDPNGNAEEARFFVGYMEGKKPEEKTERPHTVNMGKVLGTMYVRWEEKTAETTLDTLFNRVTDAAGDCIQNDLQLYFADYTQRMSKTVKNRIAELQRYAGDIKALVSAKGRAAPETSRLAKFVSNLHQHFDHKDALTVSEFAGLLKRYTPEMNVM